MPVGRNSPQKAPLGLYAEQLSGTAFTVPRSGNKRTWTYRIRPSVIHKPFVPFAPAGKPAGELFRSSPFDEVITAPNQLRWDPLPIPDAPTDFVEGIIASRHPRSFSQAGIAVHIYPRNRGMGNR